MIAYHVVEHMAVGGIIHAVVRHLNSNRQVTRVCISQEDENALAGEGGVGEWGRAETRMCWASEQVQARKMIGSNRTKHGHIV